MQLIVSLHTHVAAIEEEAENFAVTSTNPYTLNLSWDPPQSTENLPTFYNVTCTTEHGPPLVQQYNDSGAYVVDGLAPFTEYTCDNRVYSTAGRGPNVTISVVTQEAGTAKCSYLVQMIIYHLLMYSSHSSRSCVKSLCENG